MNAPLCKCSNDGRWVSYYGHPLWVVCDACEDSILEGCRPDQLKFEPSEPEED